MSETTLPPAILPMLATLAEPFDAADHYFELKWDGIRCLAFVDGGVRLQSRNRKPLNETYPDLLGIDQAVTAGPCILDGEIVALRHGKPSFLALQKRHHARRPETIRRVLGAIPVVYLVFDILYGNGENLTRLPFIRRREALVDCLKENDRFILTHLVPERGLDYFTAAGRLGLEGVVGKQAESPYLPGKRSRYWVKFKQTKVASFVICGYTENPTTRGTLSALVLGAYLDGRLTNFGLVGTGFTQEELGALHRELGAMRTETCPFTGTALRMKELTWAEPRLVCDVQYLELTDGGTLRHPLYKGRRDDIEPEECLFSR